MNQISLPAWRSILFVPAHQSRFVNHAHTRDADAIQLDLEDSVPLSHKQEAALALDSAIRFLVSHKVDVIVRVNRDLGRCIDDLHHAVHPNVIAITLPKVMGPDHIRLIDEHIAKLEIERSMPVGGIRLIALVETPVALLNVEALAESCPRLGALALGSEDLSLNAGFEPLCANLMYPCQRLLFAAKVSGIRAYGFPGSIADFRDEPALKKSIELARSMGFDGAFCIHPNQVSVINDVFSLDKLALQEAQKIVDAYEAGVKKGAQGAVEVDGRMIDLPVVLRAKEILKG